MKINERDLKTRDFENELFELERKHGMTRGELIGVYAAKIASYAKGMRREEREEAEDDE